MIPANSLRLMEALLSYGTEGCHREGLMRQADMSTATFYRALGPLLTANLVQEQDGRYSLPLAHPHNFSFKLWHDQMRLLNLTPQVREEVLSLCLELQRKLGAKLQALWFHGSAAQNNLRPDSDFDFLAVVREDAEVAVLGSLPVQVVVFTAPHFSSLFAEGEAFLRTVLTHGLLLFDRQFAQNFYARPMPASSPLTLKERGDIQEQTRSKLFSFLRLEEPEEARRALSQLAVHITRTMLAELGEVPAGKEELITVAQLYFGPTFTLLLKQCLEKNAPEAELFGLSGQLEQWQRQFAIQAGFIKELTAGLHGSPLQFEASCLQMLRSLSDDTEHLSQDTGNTGDFVLRRGEHTLHIEVKTLKRASVSPGSISTSQARPLVLVLNYLKELPISQRPPITKKQWAAFEKRGIILIDSKDLLQLCIRKLLALEPESPGLKDLHAAIAELVRQRALSPGKASEVLETDLRP